MKHITLGRLDIFRDTDSNPEGRELIASEVLGLSYIDNTVSNETTYWYWVKATDSSMETTESNVVSANPRAVPLATISNEQDRSFRIYPNPVDGHLTIATDKSGYSRFTIYDIYGKSVSEEKITEEAREWLIDINSLSKGVYVLALYGNQQTQTRTFVKK